MWSDKYGNISRKQVNILGNLGREDDVLVVFNNPSSNIS